MKFIDCLFAGFFLIGTALLATCDLREMIYTYEPHTIYHTVKAGDNMYDISGKYFHLDKKSVCFDEFWHNVARDNKELIDDNGTIHPGDKVIINYYTIKDN